MIKWCVIQLFKYINDHSKAQVEYKVSVRVMELYQTMILDLLDNKRKLSMQEDYDQNHIETTAKSIQIDSIIKFDAVIKKAVSKRAVSQTAMNRASSRSFMIIILEMCKFEDGKCSKSTQTFVDMPGKEKQKDSKASESVLDDASCNNQSLSQFTLVVGRLLEMELYSKWVFVPYRDSKITRILKYSLVSGSNTSMLVTLHSEKKYERQTIETVKFALTCTQLKKQVTHRLPSKLTTDENGQPKRVIINDGADKKDMADAMIRSQSKSLEAELQRQKEQMDELYGVLGRKDCRIDELELQLMESHQNVHQMIEAVLDERQLSDETNMDQLEIPMSANDSMTEVSQSVLMPNIADIESLVNSIGNDMEHSASDTQLDVRLKNVDEWTVDVTEMRVEKLEARPFTPAIDFMVVDIDATTLYSFVLVFRTVDNNSYRYANGKWMEIQAKNKKAEKSKKNESDEQFVVHKNG